MTAPHGVHTADNQVPSLDDELEDMLAALRGVHPALDLAADAFRHLLLDRLDIDTTQTVIAALGGWEARNLVALTGAAIARLANPDTNPALRALPLDQQKICQLNGEATAYALNHPDLAQFASDTSAAIDSH